MRMGVLRKKTVVLREKENTQKDSHKRHLIRLQGHPMKSTTIGGLLPRADRMAELAAGTGCRNPGRNPGPESIIAARRGQGPRACSREAPGTEGAMGNPRAGSRSRSNLVNQPVKCSTTCQTARQRHVTTSSRRRVSVLRG